MTIEYTGTSKPTTYHFRSPRPLGGWALCTVNDTTGELCITSDWGNFSYRWNPSPGCLGAASLTEFIGRRHEDDVDYLAGKLNVESEEFDHHATVMAFCKMLCKQRLRDGRWRNRLGLDALIARSLWSELHAMDDCGEDLFLERFCQIYNHGYITNSPWEYLVMKQTRQDGVLRAVILPALIKACKEAIR